MSDMDGQPSYGRVSVRNGGGEGGTVVSFPAPSLPDLESVRFILGPTMIHLSGDGSGELIALEEESVPSLAEWLLERLAEDEQTARDAAREHEKAVREFLSSRPDDMEADPDERPEVWSGGTNEEENGHYYCGVWAGDGIKLVATMHNEGDRDTADHIARHDPARVLAEVAAKRAIVEHVSRWEHDNPDGGGYYSCPLVPDSSRALDEDWDGESCWCGLTSRQLAILGPLARPYAGRADYRQEWAR